MQTTVLSLILFKEYFQSIIIIYGKAKKSKHINRLYVGKNEDFLVYKVSNFIFDISFEMEV